MFQPLIWTAVFCVLVWRAWRSHATAAAAVQRCLRAEATLVERQECFQAEQKKSSTTGARLERVAEQLAEAEQRRIDAEARAAAAAAELEEGRRQLAAAAAEVAEAAAELGKLRSQLGFLTCALEAEEAHTTSLSEELDTAQADLKELAVQLVHQKAAAERQAAIDAREIENLEEQLRLEKWARQGAEDARQTAEQCLRQALGQPEQEGHGQRQRREHWQLEQGGKQQGKEGRQVEESQPVSPPVVKELRAQQKPLTVPTPPQQLQAGLAVACGQ